MKVIGIAAILLILIAILGLVAYWFFGTTIPPRNIVFKDLNVSDSKIILNGADQADSVGIIYRWNHVDYKDGTLYIKFFGGLAFKALLPFLPLQETTDFNVSIDKNKYGTIKEIYLQGDSPSENLLIWPKK